MRSPAELYIRYLIILPAAYVDQTIVDMLREKQLDPISIGYIKKLREQCKLPEPFFPFDALHHESKTFLSEAGVYFLFHQTAETRAALRILESPRGKEFIESMVLSGAPDRAISIALEKQYNIKATPASVATYKCYFWNINLVDSTEMKALLMRRVEAMAESTDPDVVLQARAYKTASYTDPRRVAANLPNSPISAMMAQMRMGSMPSLVQLAQVTELARFAATMRVAEAALYGGPEDSNKAMNYAITAEKMTTQLEQIVKPDEQLVEQLASIALRTQAADAVPNIHALSGGVHTVDLQAREKSHEPVPPSGGT